MVLTLHPGCHLEVGRSCAVRQSPTRSRQRVQMTSRLVNAATHGGTARAGRCTPVRLRRTSVTRGWSITTNTSGTHRTQPVTATLLRNRRREKTVVRKQLDPQRAPFAPLLWARPWYTQAVTEKELHTRTPHGAKKEKENTSGARASPQPSGFQARRTGRSLAHCSSCRQMVTQAGGSVQIHIHTN